MTVLVTRTCNGTRKDGNACRSTAVNADGLCFAHACTPLQLAQHARKAAARSSEVRREQAKTVRQRFAEKLEEHADELWQVFYDAMMAANTALITKHGVIEREDHATRIRAAVDALNQAFGRPPQGITAELTGPGGGPLEIAHVQRLSLADVAALALPYVEQPVIEGEATELED